LPRISTSTLYAASRRTACWLAATCGLLLLGADRLERITFTDIQQDQRRTLQVAGRVLTEAQDGGILLQGRDGRLWPIPPEQLAKREPTEREFQPAPPEELGQQLRNEFGPEFDVYVTPHYVLCANTGDSYAEWCGGLFERLYTAFHMHWKQRGVELAEPEFPLVAILFRDERQFATFAARDAGPGLASPKGYFSIPTNRIVLYDLTASEGAAGTAAEIERRLEAVPFNVATVIHEATHQIAFNSGLHTRFADNPLWFTEGMAMYFETPDFRTGTNWRSAGALNRMRLRQFRDYVSRRRKPDSLMTLLQSDTRFTDAETAADAYAESWALTYYLIKTRGKDYVTYLQRLAAKSRLVWNTPDERLDEFRDVFGQDLSALDAEFLRYMQRFNRIR